MTPTVIPAMRSTWKYSAICKCESSKGKGGRNRATRATSFAQASWSTSQRRHLAAASRTRWQSDAEEELSW